MAESEGLRGCWGACLTCSSSPTPERPGAVRNSPNYFDAGLRLPFEVPWLRGLPPAPTLVQGLPKFLFSFRPSFTWCQRMGVLMVQ